jgi:hypothetical protein
MKTCHKNPMIKFMSLRGTAGRVERVLFSLVSRPNLHMNWRLLRRAVALLAMTLLISSCAVMDVWNATPTVVIATETPQPTATIDWFPASATPTLGALSTKKPPTPEMRPGLGTTILTDDFSGPSLWDTATSDNASAEIDNNQLNLAVQSHAYLVSLRHDLSESDYYAEITARPSLCRGDDAYGLLVRANAVAYYRFSLSCNGTAYAERISVGTHELLQIPLASGDVPRGAPGEVRIGVWAVGSELRLFLNGRYQFSINNSNYPSGTIGVFVNSAGDTPAVVSFSHLELQEVDYSPATTTPMP